MKRCRTCKYWAVRSPMIGVGYCGNTEVNLRVLPSDKALIVAQDFGCVFHELGPQPPSLYPPEQDRKFLADFLVDRPTTP